MSTVVCWAIYKVPLKLRDYCTFTQALRSTRMLPLQPQLSVGGSVILVYTDRTAKIEWMWGRSCVSGFVADAVGLFRSPCQPETYNPSKDIHQDSIHQDSSRVLWSIPHTGGTCGPALWMSKHHDIHLLPSFPPCRCCRSDARYEAPQDLLSTYSTEYLL
jgi:hypothetical protein